MAARRHKRLINFDRAFHKITATDCDTVRRSWIFDAGIKRKVAKGQRRKERPDSPWAEEIVRGTTNAFGEGMGTMDSFCLIPPPIIQEGRKMGWERVRPARGVWRLAEHIFVLKCGARRPAQRPGRSRSPDVSRFLLGATQRAHWRILAQRAEFVQPMVGGFFQTRNP